MSFVWTFEPEVSPEPKKEEAAVKAKRPPKNPWCAPDHARIASQMARDFPRDDKGVPLSTEKMLVLDPKPEILQKKRTPRFLRPLEQPRG